VEIDLIFKSTMYTQLNVPDERSIGNPSAKMISPTHLPSSQNVLNY